MGQEWDVFGPRGGEEFEVDDVASALGKKLLGQRQDERMIKVIINTVWLSEDEQRQVRAVVEERGWTDSVLFGRSRLEGTR